MKKQILFLSTVMFGALNAFTQTPYDNFAPEQNVKSMIELPKMQFKVANTDPNSKIRYIEFDESTLSLNLLNANDSILGTLVLSPNDKKFLTMDRFAEKYPNISPYAYCLNNPVRNIDPTGDEVWIYYDDENGKRQQMLYTANMKYEGNNAFVSTSVNYLNSMYSNGGSDVLDVLIGSKNSFNMVNQMPTDSKGNVLDAMQFNEAVGGGGNIYAGLLMSSNYSDYTKLESTSHELFHGFQSENGQGGASIFNEVEADVYSSVITTNWANSTDYFGALSSNGLGNGTAAGDLYQTSFSNLVRNGFSKGAFIDAVRSFRAGSNSNASGGYNTYPVHRNQKYYLLQKYLPKLK